MTLNLHYWVELSSNITLLHVSPATNNETFNYTTYLNTWITKGFRKEAGKWIFKCMKTMFNNIFLSLSVSLQSRSYPGLATTMSVSWLWNIWRRSALLCWPRCCCPPAPTFPPRNDISTTLVSWIIPTCLFVKTSVTPIICWGLLVSFNWVKKWMKNFVDSPVYGGWFLKLTWMGGFSHTDPEKEDVGCSWFWLPREGLRMVIIIYCPAGQCRRRTL